MALTAIFMAFPKPLNMSFSYPKSWGAEEAGSWAASFSGNFTGAGASLGGAALKNLAGLFPGNAYSAASAELNGSLNKRNVVVFQDLPFREVSIAWALRPRNKGQAADFMNSIDTLKKVSAPILAGADSLWDVRHCTFELEIKTSGPTLFKSQQLVIKNITVDYTPNGFWSQHTDGYPTQINLSIELMETELLDITKFGDYV